MLTNDELGLFIYLSEKEDEKKKERIIEDILNYSDDEDLKEMIIEDLLND